MKCTFILCAALLASAASFNAQTGPPQATAAGFSHLAFDDEFTTLSVAPSNTALGTFTWYPGIWWQGAVPSASQITLNGGLNLQWTRAYWQATAHCDASVESFSKLAASGASFRYGYFEASMKWDNVVGAWPAIWLIPVEGINGDSPTGELDIFEGSGGVQAYYGTLHVWNKSKHLWFSSPNSFKVPAGTDFSQFHTYGMLWTPPTGGFPGQVTWYFDNQPVGTATTGVMPDGPFDSQRYLLVLGAQEGVGWKACAPLTDGSPAAINMTVGWVRVWSK